MRFTTSLVLALACWLSMLSAPSAWAVENILFGGAAITGVYYQVALQISSLMNNRLGDKYHYVGRPTNGSVFNIRAIQRGAFDFGVAQSDRNWQAYNGTADWEGEPIEKLRSVFSMHPETVLLVTRQDTGIRRVEDLRGRRVNIGNPGSGQRGNAEDVLRLYGLDLEQDIRVEGLQQAEASRALVDRRVDAFFYTVGNPSATIEEPATSVDIRLIPIDAPQVRDFVDQHSYYIPAEIPAGTYNGIDEAIETYAVTATVITSVQVDDQIVYDLVKTVFENLDELKASHAAFRHLQPEQMLSGLSAPFHPGAQRYYQERGWLIPGEE